MWLHLRHIRIYDGGAPVIVGRWLRLFSTLFDRRRRAPPPLLIVMNGAQMCKLRWNEVLNDEGLGLLYSIATRQSR